MTRKDLKKQIKKIIAIHFEVDDIADKIITLFEQQCHNRDELIDAYFELEKILQKLPITLSGIAFKHEQISKIRDKINQLKSELS